MIHFILKNKNIPTAISLLYLLFVIVLLPSCNKLIKENDGMVFIKGGTFEMGGDNAQARADEFPKHKVQVSSFWIDATEVTNAQFAQFVKATNYVTTAEKDFDFNVVIRSIMYNQINQYLSYQVGSGITFYSNAEEEYKECLLKAKAIEKVLQ